MSTDPPPRVCVVVIGYNSEDTLPRCLTSLGAQTFRDFSLLLIDNASARKPTSYLPSLPYPTEIIERDTNIGFAGAMALAVRMTTSPLIAALNPDAFAEPGWLAALVTAADRYADVAAFGSLQISAGDERRIDGFGDHYLVTGQAWRGQTRPSETDAVAYCFGVCGAAALYRTDAVRAVGNFDERFFCLYEDVDLSFRLRLAGHQCAVVSAAVVKHVGGATFRGHAEMMQVLIGRNQWWVLVKNMPAALLPLTTPGFFAVELLAALRGHRPASLRGLWQGLRQTAEMLPSRRAIQAARKVSFAEICRWLTWNPMAFLRKRSAVKRPPLSPLTARNGDVPPRRS